MNIAEYARYSSDNQSSASIDAQLRAIREWATREGHTVVRTYTDEARTATTDDRPNFIKAIRDAEKGMFDALVVHKLDRFARNRYDAAFYRKKLKDAGVALISVLEPLDNNPESIILESVLDGMAEYYSANLGREVKKGLKEKALQCKHLGGIPLYGYDVTPERTYIINPERAEVVRTIYKMYADGEGYGEIIGWLNGRGYRSATGGKWGKNSIYDLVRNEKYTGVYIYNRCPAKGPKGRNFHSSKPSDEQVRIPGGMPQIIDIETFSKAQERSKSKRIGGVNTAKRVYLLSGLVYCGECGHSMHGSTGPTGRAKVRRSYYICGKKSNQHGCSAKNINADYLAELVLDHLRVMFGNVENRKIIAVDVLRELALDTKDEAKEKNALRANLGRIDTEIANITRAIAAGMFHKTMIETMDRLEQERESVRLELAKLEATEHRIPSETELMEYMKNINLKKGTSPEQLKQAVQGCVSRVNVHHDYVEIIMGLSVTGEGGSLRATHNLNLTEYRHGLSVTGEGEPKHATDNPKT